MILTLTVSPHGNQNNPYYLLCVSTADKEFIYPQVKILLTGGIDEPTIINLGRAFDHVGGISDPAVNRWIIQNNYHVYPPRQPTKLKFKLLQNWLVFVE